MAKELTSRPFGITLLMIYGYFVGVLNVAAGIFIILDRNDPDLITESFHTPNQLLSAGIVALIIGLLILLMSTALGYANNVVRVIFAVIASLNLATGLWAAIALHAEQQAAGIVSALFSVLVLYLLFNRKADEYFDSKK